MKQFTFLVFWCLAVTSFSQSIPCDGEVVILDNVAMPSDTIAASDSLLSASIVLEGSTVIFQSPIIICFDNGFEVQATSIFTVQMDDCIGNTGFSFADIFGTNIDLESLENYSNQNIPSYIEKDNTNGNNITDIGATLGRVLFYDKALSLNETISCASCHQQANAFSDLSVASTGISGTTGRHSMRLINTRFADELRFFWDERAQTLEEQSTQPIQDHVEMGFSGTNGDPNIDSLFVRMSDLPYYPILFDSMYGSTEITEGRIQNALAQFIRSIQSFDSKFDIGRAGANNNGQPFTNFSNSENRGKTLFLQNTDFNNDGERIGGGLGCQGCHRAPEFDIRPNSRNNGIVGVIGAPGSTDFTNTRSPSLRDMFNPEGSLNGPLMHDGSLLTVDDVIDHYNSIPEIPGNNNLDNRLRPDGQVQRLQITAEERIDLIAFLRTLGGEAVYTNPIWSDPFIE